MEGLNKSSLSNMSNKIIKLFKEDIIELANKNNFSRRIDSKLSPEVFFISWVMGFMINPMSSYEDLCQIIKYQSGIKISRQGLCKKVMNDRCLNFMHEALNNFLMKLKENNPPLSKVLDQFSHVNIIDSTSISLPECLNDVYPGYGGSNNKGFLKMQLMLDGISEEVNHIDITTVKQNDQGYKGYLKNIKENSLYLQDLGYFSTAKFIKIHNSKAYFISKHISGVNIYDHNQEKIDLCATLKKIKEDNIIINAYLGKKKDIPIRMVIKRAPLEVVKKRLTETKRKMNKRAFYSIKQCPKNKYLCNWTIYITNVPEDKLSNNEIFNIYPLRWQIELFFKLNKSLLALDRIAGKTKNRVLCEIYAKLISVVLFLYMIIPVKELAERKISIYRSFNKLKNFGYQLLVSLGSKYKLTKFLKGIIDDWLDFGLKDKKTKKYLHTLDKIDNSTHNTRWLYV